MLPEKLKSLHPRVFCSVSVPVIMNLQTISDYQSADNHCLCKTIDLVTKSIDCSYHCV